MTPCYCYNLKISSYRQRESTPWMCIYVASISEILTVSSKNDCWSISNYYRKTKNNPMQNDIIIIKIITHTLSDFHPFSWCYAHPSHSWGSHAGGIATSCQQLEPWAGKNKMFMLMAPSSSPQDPLRVISITFSNFFFLHAFFIGLQLCVTSQFTICSAFYIR